MRTGLIPLILATAALTACVDETRLWKDAHFETTTIEKTDKEVKVPKSVVQKIEKMYLAHMRKHNPNETRTDIQLLLEVPRAFFEISVQLKNLGSEILERDVDIGFPRGGGYVDLGQFLSDKRGKFRLRVNVGLGGEEHLKQLKVYFISGSRKRHLGQETLGAGCNTVLDVSEFFVKKLVTGTESLYTADGRHASLLMGTFVLVFLEEGQMRLSTISFTDSRYSNLQCEETESDAIGA